MIMTEYRVYNPKGTYAGIKALTDAMVRRLESRGYAFELVKVTK